jgi:hypothetical protein
LGPLDLLGLLDRFVLFDRFGLLDRFVPFDRFGLFVLFFQYIQCIPLDRLHRFHLYVHEDHSIPEYLLDLFVQFDLLDRFVPLGRFVPLDLLSLLDL